MILTELESSVAFNKYIETGAFHAANDIYCDETTIRRILKRDGYEVGTVGRTALPLSMRSAALRMELYGYQPQAITRGHNSIFAESSFYRMKRHTLAGETMHQAVGMLILHPQTGELLIHDEKYSNPRVGKFEGTHSCQLSWKAASESPIVACTRTFQREVFSAQPIKVNELHSLLHPVSDGPITKIQVADVEVSIYGFVMDELGVDLPFSSPKVKNIHWATKDEVYCELANFRSGAREAIEVLLDLRQNCPVIDSQLNIDYKSRFASTASGLIL